MVAARFTLVGEGWPLVSIANYLAKRDDAEIVEIASSDVSNEELARNAGGSIRSVLEFMQGPIARSDWLINLNSDKVLSGASLANFNGKALNLHNGPLPAYAGRHVQQWGIRNGEVEFASTVHFMEPGVDTGDVVAERRFPIRSDDTGLSLFVTSFREGRKLMVDILNRILLGATLPRYPQDLSKRRNYRHADSLDPRVPWTQGARKVVDFLRAGDYRPLRSPSYTASVKISAETVVTVFRAEAMVGHPGLPGAVLAITQRGPIVGCGEDSVLITDASLEGKVVNPLTWRHLITNFGQATLPGC